MNNAAIIATFEHSILSVRFLENAKIEIDDMKELYAYGNMCAHGQSYCVLFEAVAHYEVSEEAIEYFAIDNPSNSRILAKAYVVGGNKEAGIKTKMHLLFDQPKIEPQVFNTHEEARKFLEAVVQHFATKGK